MLIKGIKMIAIILSLFILGCGLEDIIKEGMTKGKIMTIIFMIINIFAIILE